jgi:Icc-related predicted phosphoesterase
MGAMHRDGQERTCVRIAAAGDIHCSEAVRGRVEQAFAEIADTVDLILLAGDLTTHGEPEQGAVLADACRGLSVPVYAVLGNHDYHANRHDELVAAVEEGGVRLLDRSWGICETAGTRIGIVGAKGFIGGFPGSYLPDFGEPLLRQAYRETSAEADAIRRGLEEIADCPLRLVLLHYAPTETTLHGEPHGIWTFLGCDRLGIPIADHRPDLVVHGHAHAGSFEGSLGSVQVFNVAVHVTGRDFWVFELDAPTLRPSLEPPEVRIET